MNNYSFIGIEYKEFTSLIFLSFSFLVCNNSREVIIPMTAPKWKIFVLPPLKKLVIGSNVSREMAICQGIEGPH